MTNRLVFIFFFISLFSFGQTDTDEQLAMHYANEGDCERAITYFEKIYDSKPSQDIFSKYLGCLKKLDDERGVIKLIEQQIKFHPRNPEYSIQLGVEYENQGNQRKADKSYESAVDDLRGNSREIINLQKAFSKFGKYEYALQTLQKGRKILKGNYPLNIQFAEVYGEMGRTEDMIEEYINLLSYSPGMLNTLQRIMPRMIDFENEDSKDFEILRQQLIKKIQKNPDERTYAEMLIWAFVQRQNFSAALIQAKGLDKRTSKDGKEVFNIGRLASNNKDFETARKAFQYVVELGEGLPYYYPAEQALLNTRFKEITVYRNYSDEQIENTLKEYKTAIERIGPKSKAVPLVLELSHILAFYSDRAKDATELLEKALEYRSLTDINKAEIKLLLADVYVILDEIWEASLLYMQVEKDFKYEEIGQEAKFKNARVFYFDGDFKWAQSQLDVLKASTSKLIANDALKLSVFITENLGLDSNYRAMNKFAQADLLLMQHKYDDAFHLMDSLLQVFPYHSLADDVLMRKAQAMQQRGKWQEAIDYYDKVVQNHADGLHIDEAIFEMASIYENYLFDNEKAKDLYFKILKEHKGSLFVTEARKRFRNLQEST